MSKFFVCNGSRLRIQQVPASFMTALSKLSIGESAQGYTRVA